jgi:tRNA(Ile)-lysidine synthase
MRPRSVAPGSHVRLIRPLLGWRRDELQQLCNAAGLNPVVDPGNSDERFERVRVRNALGYLDWLDPLAVARSAANLADADTALDWAARNEWKAAVRERGGAIAYRPGEAPPEIVRRIIARAIRKLATEGEADLRGSQLDRLLETLREGGTTTIRGVLCSGAREWRFTAAPPRRS